MATCTSVDGRTSGMSPGSTSQPPPSERAATPAAIEKPMPSGPLPGVPTSGSTTTTYTGGHELWGFIPPILLDELDDTMISHQWMVDGTPVVQDVITARTGVGSAADWRTVLVMGFRQGAKGFFALDVTDPFAPKFLWQYTHTQMGDTFGQPRMAQVNIQFPSGALHQRTVAILPGGAGTELTGTFTPTDSRHIPKTVSGIAPRTSRDRKSVV